MRDFSFDLQPGLVQKLDSVDKFASETYLNKLKMLVFSHRHTSNKDFIKNSPVDWSVVRYPSYKHSDKAKVAFFREPEFAFLFCLFAISGKTGDFCKEEDRNRIVLEVDALAVQARA